MKPTRWLYRPQFWAAVILASWVAVVIPTSDPSFVLGGIQVNEPDHQDWVERLRMSGMNTVEVTVYAKQGDWNSANLWWQDEQPWVIHEIATARAAGLQVVLILRVALDHAFEANRHYWHGQIWPLEDHQLDQWFDRYQTFVEKWAKLAEQHGVGILVVGSELNSLASTTVVERLPDLQAYWLDAEAVAKEQQSLERHRESISLEQLATTDGTSTSDLDELLSTNRLAQRRWSEVSTFQDSSDPVAQLNRRRQLLDQRWRTVIGTARSHFSGKLTYAANFDQFQQVGFWDALDWMGINAYFPLRSTWSTRGIDSSALPELEQSWEKVFGEIENTQRAASVWRQPVLFTELGYTMRRGSTFRPWTQDGFDVVASETGERLVVWDQQPIDLGERALAVRALRNIHQRIGTPLQGILYWKLSTRRPHREIEPFVLLIDPRSEDPLLRELTLFNRKTGWRRIVNRLRQAPRASN